MIGNRVILNGNITARRSSDGVGDGSRWIFRPGEEEDLVDDGSVIGTLSVMRRRIAANGPLEGIESGGEGSEVKKLGSSIAR
jgi:hypothetical protein